MASKSMAFQCYIRGDEQAPNIRAFHTPFSIISLVPKSVDRSSLFTFPPPPTPRRTTKLANPQSQPSLEEQEEHNEKHVTAFYQALASKDVDTVHRLLVPDLEWWFHGPPSHQYLMRLLTGSSSSFIFVPISIVAFGSTVLAEGYDKKRSVSWVHAWTLTDGIITHVKEYFNTSVTVKRFANVSDGGDSPSASPPAAVTANCQSVWQSKICDESVPGLVLAL